MSTVMYGKHTMAALGTFATLLVADPAAVDAASEMLAGELAAIDVACSRFRADSELSRACAAGGHPVPVSPLFAEALSVALTAAELTGGDVDPTCGRALAGLGYDRDFALARQITGFQAQLPVPGGRWREVVLDVGRQEVTVPDGVLLDLGATAKALAADRAAAAIAAATGCGALVNLGGDISVAGPPPEEGWLVGVADDATFDTTTTTVRPSQVIIVMDGGLATSSVLGRAWQRGGTHLHHIIDPRTGMPAGSCWRTVSVAAGTCVDANIASTAAIVRGEGAVAWLERLRLPARLVTRDGQVVTAADWPASAFEGTRERAGDAA
jgi:thiamine biosynthesis lipoprotein